MRYSKALRSRLHEFRISGKSLARLKAAGVRSIFIGGGGYARVICNGQPEHVHRLLMRLSGKNIKGLEVDHKNGNRLDNRLWNLRVATTAQNRFNRSRSKNNSSGFNGVCFHKGQNRWLARIGRPQKHIGSFRSASEAARAYNAAAKKRYGKFAKLNCI